MKILFTDKLRRDLIDLGYTWIAYFDGPESTILYPFKSPVPEEKLAQLNFHQFPMEDPLVNHMANVAADRKIYISEKYFAVLSE